METSELAAMAVAVLTATATGAAGAVGQGAGTAVTDALRARLVSTERGRAAVDTLDRGPADPAAQDSARSLLQAEFEADPELRRQLHRQLTAPGGVTTGSMLITGSRVSRSPIALGPLTVNNTRSGRAFIALMATALVALVVLAVYGGVNLVLVDDSPGSSPDTGAGRAVRALNVSEVKQVVPDLTSMPSGWERSGSVRSGRNEDSGCTGAQARFTSAYGRDSSGTLVRAEFTAWSCPTAALTATDFRESWSGISSNNKARELSLPELGDQRAALTHYNGDLDETTAHALLRVGTVLIELE
ncbi:hypothetical protein [Streptomyces sp. NPDC003832]